MPDKQRGRGMLIVRVSILSTATVVLSLLLLGGTAVAAGGAAARSGTTPLGSPALATPALATPTSATAIIRAQAERAESETSAAVTPAAASLSPLEQLWQDLVALFQQLLARYFPPPTLPLPYSGTAEQLVTVVAPSPGAATATVTAWSRTASGWTAVIGPVQANIGPAGVGQASEATSVTPAGVYPLTQAFGRQANPGTRLPYFQTDRLDWWDENPASSTYNTHVRQQQSPGGNSENLYDAGSVYDYAVNIDYNTARVPGAGSAFFLHVTNGGPTAGCVAIPAADLTAIMRWLDPAARPVIDIGSD